MDSMQIVLNIVLVLGGAAALVLTREFLNRSIVQGKPVPVFHRRQVRRKR